MSLELKSIRKWVFSIAAIAALASPCWALPVGDVVTDSRIEHWVEQAIRADPRVAGSEVDATTVAGMVRLEGEAASLAARDYAAREALKIRGVLGVVNELRLRSEPRSSAELTRALEERFRGDDLLATATIGVDVVGGVVRLQGVVPTDTATEEAELLARETPGVTRVESTLSVVEPAILSDAEVAAAVRAVLRRDVYLTSLPITAEVRAGVVTLAGEAHNPYEKERAGLLPSWLSGIREVRNDIVLVASEDDGTRARKPELPDDEIATYVRAQLRRDERVDPSGVTVRVFSGDVTLSGSVPAVRQRELAVEDATSTVGVESVTNELEVRPLPSLESKVSPRTPSW